jgi:hypothetical protein
MPAGEGALLWLNDRIGQRLILFLSVGESGTEQLALECQGELRLKEPGVYRIGDSELRPEAWAQARRWWWLERMFVGLSPNVELQLVAEEDVEPPELR